MRPDREDDEDEELVEEVGDSDLRGGAASLSLSLSEALPAFPLRRGAASLSLLSLSLSLSLPLSLPCGWLELVVEELFRGGAASSLSESSSEEESNRFRVGGGTKELPSARPLLDPVKLCKATASSSIIVGQDETGMAVQGTVTGYI